MSDDIYPLIRRERMALVAYASTVPAEDWARQSLCSAWTNKQVLAHVVAGAGNTVPHFLGGMIGSGFNFDKFVGKDLARVQDRSPEELMTALEGLAERRTKPARAMLGEAVIHAEDIRFALGVPAGEHAEESLRMVADTYHRAGPPLRSKQRVAGLRLRSTDLDWSAGEGPEVAGPMIPLLLAITGRRAGLPMLTGDGVATLASRMPG